MTRLSQKALRLYDQKGLLVPEEKDLLQGTVITQSPSLRRE